MIVRWPGQVAAGAVSDFPWSFADVLPTLADLAGARGIPRQVDGISVAWAVDSSPMDGDFRAEAVEAILASLDSQERGVEASAGEGEGAGMRRSRTKKFKPPVYNPKKHRPMVYKKPRIRR